jgi:creatinine amidohydrolase
LGNGRSAKLAWQTQDYNPWGAVGNAAAATTDNGHALVQAAGRGLARLLQEIDQLPADTLTQRTAYV